MCCPPDVGDLHAACENLSAVIRSLVSTGAELSRLEDPLSGQGSARIAADCNEPVTTDSWLNQAGDAKHQVSSDDLWLQEAMCNSTTQGGSQGCTEQGLPAGFTAAHNVFDCETSGCCSSSFPLPCPNKSGSLAHQVSCHKADDVNVLESDQSWCDMNTGCTAGSSRGGSCESEHGSHPRFHPVPLTVPSCANVPHTSGNASRLLASCLMMRAEARRRLGQPGAVWMADLQRAALLLARGP